MISFGVATAAGTNTAGGRTGNGTFSVAMPAGYAAGQLGIIVAYTDAGTLSINQSWLTVSGAPWGSATPKLYVFYKFLGASETNPTITVAGGGSTNGACGACMTFNGVDTTTPIEVVGTASAGTGTPMTAGSIITASPNSWALGICGRGDNEASSGQSFGGSTTGVTERLDAGSAGGDDSQVSAYSKLITNIGATGNGSATTSATDPWVSVLLALKAGPIQGNIIQTTEADTSQAVGLQKNKVVVQITETEIAQAVGKQKRRSVGQAMETDSAQGLVTKVSTALETDLSQTFGRLKNKSIVQLSESDSAQSIGKKKLKEIALVSESDISQPVSKTKRKSLTTYFSYEIYSAPVQEAVIYYFFLERKTVEPYHLVDEMDYLSPDVRNWKVGQSANPSFFVTLPDDGEEYAAGIVAENGLGIYSAMDVNIFNTNIFIISETDVAFDISERKEKIISQVLETEISQIIGRVKRVAVAQVAETDVAQPVARLKRKSIAQVEEIDVANEISDGSFKLGQVIETDVALPFLKRKYKSISQVMEQDSAEVITGEYRRKPKVKKWRTVMKGNSEKSYEIWVNE